MKTVYLKLRWELVYRFNPGLSLLGRVRCLPLCRGRYTLTGYRAATCIIDQTKYPRMTIVRFMICCEWYNVISMIS